MLFDAPLQMKFHEASRQGRDYDMSQIFSGRWSKPTLSMPSLRSPIMIRSRCRPEAPVEPSASPMR